MRGCTEGSRSFCLNYECWLHEMTPTQLVKGGHVTEHVPLHMCGQSRSKQEVCKSESVITGSDVC